MRRLLPALILSIGLFPSLLSAQGIEQSVLTQLNDQGFTQITVSRTLLGRIRILAFGNGYRREIVLNPVTGEILRDYLVLIDEDGRERPSAPNLVNSGGSPPATGSGSDDNSDDDHDSADDHHDDDHEDHDSGDHSNDSEDDVEEDH